MRRHVRHVCPVGDLRRRRPVLGTLQGLPSSYFDPAPAYGLMRSLYGSPEGMACTVTTTGVLTQVEAALWNAGVDAIVMQVLLPCGGQSQVAATVSLPASAFPVYDEGNDIPQAGSDDVLRPRSAPPGRAGEPISILFHAVGAEEYDKFAVSTSRWETPIRPASSSPSTCRACRAP